MCLSQMLQLGQDVLLRCAFPFGLSVHTESYPPWCFHVAILSGRLVWAASMVAQGFKRKEQRTELRSPRTSHTPYFLG